MTTYAAGLTDVAGLTMLNPAPHVRPNYAYAVFRLRRDTRAMADHVQAALQEQTIDSRRYFDYRYRVEDSVVRMTPTPIADSAAQDVLCVPLWASILPGELERVIDTVRKAMDSP